MAGQLVQPADTKLRHHQHDPACSQSRMRGVVDDWSAKQRVKDLGMSRMFMRISSEVRDETSSDLFSMVSLRVSVPLSHSLSLSLSVSLMFETLLLSFILLESGGHQQSTARSSWSAGTAIPPRSISMKPKVKSLQPSFRHSTSYDFQFGGREDGELGAALGGSACKTPPQ